MQHYNNYKLQKQNKFKFSEYITQIQQSRQLFESIPIAQSGFYITCSYLI